MLFVGVVSRFRDLATGPPTWITANDLGQKRLNTKSLCSKLKSALEACERLPHDDRLLLLKEIATRCFDDYRTLLQKYKRRCRSKASK